MNGHFLKLNSLETYVKVELDLSNYATQTDSQNATGIDTQEFCKKTELTNLKSDVNKLGINQTQTLKKLKLKLPLFMIMINILLPMNLIS